LQVGISASWSAEDIYKLKCDRRYYVHVFKMIYGHLCYRCDELSTSLSVSIPRRVVKKPIPAVKEALLREALVARKVTPVKCTAPSKFFMVLYFWATLRVSDTPDNCGNLVEIFNVFWKLFDIFYRLWLM